MQNDNLDFQRISGSHDPQKSFDSLFTTAPEIAKRVGVSKPAIYYAVRTAKFPAPLVKVRGSGVWLWLRKDAEVAIQQWMEIRASYGPNQHVGRAGAV